MNNMIILFLKNKSYSNFFRIIDEAEKKLFSDFLNKCRFLKNKLFHDEIFKITNAGLKGDLLIFFDAINLVNQKYSKYKIMKSQYLDYLQCIINEL